MPNSDAIIANGTGQTVRTDIESNLQALKSNNSTGTDPTGNNLTSYMSWANTGDNQFMIHNGTSFYPLMDIQATAGYAGTHIASPGTSAVPGYRFLNNAGTTALQTGMGLPVDTRLGFFISGLEKTSILSDGKVGIGTTAPSEMLQVNGGGAIITNNTSEAYLQIHSTDTNNSHEAYLDLATNAYSDYAARFIRFSGGANAHSEIGHKGTGDLRLHAETGGRIVFKTGTTAGNNQPERWKITPDGGLMWSDATVGAPISGDILPRGIVGKTGNNAGATTGSLYNFYWTPPTHNDPNKLQAWIDHNHVGNVDITSSDYRMKQNIALQTESGIERIKQLKPSTFQIKDYGDAIKAETVTREGFIAHEVQEVIPSGASGTKDGEFTQCLNIDAIVSVLTKALQEAVAKIETLESKVAALEGS
jgi:hypothetical protein|tara:strand:- start:1468 stop:2724 length:1257 start_codon:yes stop_codon:yes gene_type:complete